MFKENLAQSLRQLWTHKLRSFLTILAITIGVASIVAMTSLAKSGLATLTRGIEEVGGTRFIAILREPPKKAKAKRDSYTRWLTMADRNALASAIPGLEAVVASMKFYDYHVGAVGAPTIRTTVVATEAAYFRAYHMPLAEGAAFATGERRRLAVIGDTTRRRLFGDGRAVGREFHFLGERFRVAGVLVPNPKPNINLGYNWDQAVIVPITAPGMGAAVEQIDLTVARQEDAERTVRLANAILLHRHHGVDDFMIIHFEGLLKNFYLAFAIMQAVVAVIAGVALLIGGVGVMNIMLVAVNERLKEIGLRKAIGASPEAIRDQFLTESVVLSLAGAAFGVAGGLGLTWVASGVIRGLNPAWVDAWSWDAIGVAVAASMTIGVGFGWLPAMRAARLDPIRCLRHE